LSNPQIFYESGKLYKDSTYKELPQNIDYLDTRRHVWCFSRKNGFAGSCGVFTYDVRRMEGEVNKKLQIMWITSPVHNTDVNWFGIGFGQ
jgi:hypothetical protein